MCLYETGVQTISKPRDRNNKTQDQSTKLAYSHRSTNFKQIDHK